MLVEDLRLLIAVAAEQRFHDLLAVGSEQTLSVLMAVVTAPAAKILGECQPQVMASVATVQAQEGTVEAAGQTDRRLYHRYQGRCRSAVHHIQ